MHFYVFPSVTCSVGKYIFFLLLVAYEALIVIYTRAISTKTSIVVHIAENE